MEGEIMEKEVKTSFELRMEEERKIFKAINREILKSAKKDEKHYYWDIIGLSDYMVKGIISKLEKEGKTITSKGINFKVIHW
jgi:hypothetical protein